MGSMTLNLNIHNLRCDVYDKTFNGGIPIEDVCRFLKGQYSNVERMKSRFLPALICRHTEKEGIPQMVIDAFEKAEPFTFKEAFEIEDAQFRATVFGSIDVGEMIDELGSERIKVAGKPVRHKKFDKEGNFLGHEEYDVVYETYKVDGTKLEVDAIYAVKCWCTTTNEEHWIWIDERYKDDPLEAIASTFMVHESVKPHIKELKRQGDILLVEMDTEVTPDKNERMVSFTAEEYFSLLTAQS
jgi:hypothetical protein